MSRRTRGLSIAAIAIASLLVGCNDQETFTGPSENPKPRIDTISPGFLVRGEPVDEITITGTGFVGASIVIVEGEERPTAFDSEDTLRATLLARDLQGVGDVQRVVWVRNPAPGGGASEGFDLQIVDSRPIPRIDTVSPPLLVTGADPIEFQIVGGGFGPWTEIRAGGTSVPTTYVSSSLLTAIISSEERVAGVDVALVALNPPPGGGTSSERLIPVVDPLPPPTVTSITPAVTTANPSATGFTLTVRGTDFTERTSVWVGNVSNATTFVSTTELRTAVHSSVLWEAGTVEVYVVAPSPGGGPSNRVNLTIENPVPTIESSVPGAFDVSSENSEVRVNGTGFNGQTVLTIGGVVATVSSVTPTRINASVSLELGGEDATVEMIVSNPAPGGGEAHVELPTYSSRTITIAFNGVAYDMKRERLLFTGPSSDPSIGNTLTAVDPVTGELLGSTYVGSNPTVVALSDDGDVAYVALDGSGAVRRVDLTTDTAGLEFAVGTSTHYGTLFAEDIAILPGQTETVVIATYRKGVSPRHGGVFVYDDGVRRPSGTRDHTGSNRIEAVDATSLVGYNNGSTEFGLRRLVVSATGITETQVQRDVLTGFSTDIHMIGSRLFSTQGRVADPVNLTLLGTLPVNGALCGDATGDHVYVATGSSSYPYDSGAVTVFDAATLQQVSTLPLGGNAARLLLRMSDDQIVLVREGSVQIIQSRLFDTSVAR